MLRHVPFFRHLSDAQVAALQHLGRTESLNAGGVVFAEGDVADNLYIILSGEISITRRDDDGRQAIELSRLSRGDVFGELALFDGAPRSATATAVGPAELFMLGREAFLDFLAGSPGTIAELLSGISTKLRVVNDRFLVETLEKERVRVEMERERYRSLAQMVAGVAHEINTPLGIVNTAASIIAENLEPLRADPALTAVVADIDEAASLIQGNIARVNKLVQSFKNLSAAQVTDRREECDLAAVVNEIVTLFRPQARRSGLQIEISSPPADQPLRWLGFPGYLAQIVLNLLSNAERYAYPDGTGGRIEIDLATSNGDAYAIVVRDFGAGIPPAVLSRVFEPFFTTGRGRGGTGLGMAIVHNLVTGALRGTIAIDSTPAQGTTVTVIVPREVPELPGSHDEAPVVS